MALTHSRTKKRPKLSSAAHYVVAYKSYYVLRDRIEHTKPQDEDKTLFDQLERIFQACVSNTADDVVTFPSLRRSEVECLNKNVVNYDARKINGLAKTPVLKSWLKPTRCFHYV